ncbi:hypothetical protein [Actinoplanes couchii]|uniref:Uncharacterized protein n=1 Tax=Actinoplanes couchii TaxID=403638 RepID=A0ABQ3XFV9_9ACTN|nr:hypothetical protein [Actinoplanes couchii]MDR6321683.1 hypothetical protein [Actinoplanes couchii]GID57361.1 hypothetical protein Aco03nite_057650 [Actinoplanes couchii]
MSTIRRRLLAVGIGIGLAAVVGLNVFVVPRVFGAEQPDPASVAAAAAVADLPALATALAAAPAVRWSGTFESADGAAWALDARVTTAGTTLGTIKSATAIGEILAIGDRVFVRAADGFWGGMGITDARRTGFADRWVDVPQEFLGLDLAGAVGPAGITAPVAGAPTTVDGVAVQTVTAGERTFQIRTTEPKGLVSVTAPGYRVTPAVLDDTERAAFFTQLRKAAAELPTAAGLGSLITQKGRAVLQACDSGSCTAKVAFTNRVAPTAKHVTTGDKVWATIVLTRNGKTAKICPVSLTLAPGASKAATCAAEVQARNGATWRATTTPATALSEAEAKTITEALEAELPA